MYFIGLTANCRSKEFEKINNYLDDAILIERKKRGISDDIKIVNTGFMKLVSPEFHLNIVSINLNEAHEKLLDAMGKMGYKNGILYKK